MQNKKKNFISLLAIITTSLLLMVAIYFSNLVLTEMRISQSHSKASQAYYLAEAGINEAIWKLQYDTTTGDGDRAWADDFVESATCETFSDNFTRTNTLYLNSSYTVTIQNSECARGDIISTAEILLPNGNTVQRVVKTRVFKSLNPSSTQNSAVFTGGASEVIRFMAGYMNIYDGNMFSNNNILLQLVSTLRAFDNPETVDIEEGKVAAANNINQSLFSTITSTGQCAQNICNPETSCLAAGFSCPPSQIDMPMIDFDSAEATSYKSRAQALGTVYTSEEFENLMWNNQNLTLNNAVTYVTGPIELRGGQTITANGALVADGNITIGERSCWYKNIFNWRCGNSQLTVNHPEGIPSGLMTKRKIEAGLFLETININGLLYANDELSLVSLPASFNIIGGMMARKMSLVSVWQALNITLDNDLINEAIGDPTYSPIVQIEHWEETY